MSKKRAFYVLIGESNACRGMYTSMKKLRDGVNYWMCLFPNEVLSHQEWAANYAPEPNSWEWCYIPHGSVPHKIAQGGASVPQRKFWGTNLVGVKWEPIPEWEEAYK